jgi:hypothetical protein
MMNDNTRHKILETAPKRYCLSCGTLCIPYKMDIAYDTHNSDPYGCVWYKCPTQIFFGLFQNKHSDQCAIIDIYE